MAFLEQLFHSQIACSTVISGAQLNGGLYLCLTRKRHLHLRTLLEYFFFVHIFTTKQGCFPILHGNLLSHHINLSFPLRRKRLSLPLIPTTQTPHCENKQHNKHQWHPQAQQPPLEHDSSSLPSGSVQCHLLWPCGELSNGTSLSLG